jgi:hypothetical protein
LVAPEGTHFLEPGSEVVQALCSQGVYPDPVVVVALVTVDEIVRPQQPKMATECLWAYAHLLGQLSGSVRAAAQSLNHRSAGGIGQDLKKAVDSHEIGVAKIQR